MGYNFDPTTNQWHFVEINAENPAYDCRKIYGNSIMANDAAVWNTVYSNFNL